MVAGLGLDALDGVVPAYPTQGEAIRMAAEACMRSRPARWQDWLAGAPAVVGANDGIVSSASLL